MSNYKVYHARSLTKCSAWRMGRLRPERLFMLPLHYCRYSAELRSCSVGAGERATIFKPRRKKFNTSSQWQFELLILMSWHPDAPVLTPKKPFSIHFILHLIHISKLGHVNIVVQDRRPKRKARGTHTDSKFVPSAVP